MFDKILVPVDGSACAKEALKAAGGLQRTFSSAVEILHVVEMPDYGALGFLKNVYEEREKLGQEILGDSKSLFDPLLTRTRIETGDPVRVICDVAQKIDCKLIVMGNRGRGDFQGLLLGSVSHGVLQRSHCPVLLIKEPAVDLPREVAAAHGKSNLSTRASAGLLVRSQTVRKRQFGSLTAQ